MLSANCTQDRTIQMTTLETSQTEDNQLSFNIEIGLNNLRETILAGVNVPLTELTVLDKDLLLEQLNQIEANLPTDFATAVEIANHKKQIVSEAEAYACLIIKSAREKVSQILHESAIVRQAELDGAKIRLKTERECEELKQTTKEEVDRLRQVAIAECQEIQMDADSYADNVLKDIQQQLQEMLEIIHNGRKLLEATAHEGKPRRVLSGKLPTQKPPSQDRLAPQLE